MDYSYAQVAYTILLSRQTEDREYRALEAIHDNYEKYVMTMDSLIQKRNGIKHVNIADFIKNKQIFQKTRINNLCVIVADFAIFAIFATITP